MINKTMVESYGTMTNVEKRMNKADLLAYKSFDTRQYSLIPGISHKIPGTGSPGRLNNGVYDPGMRKDSTYGVKDLSKSHDYSTDA